MKAIRFIALMISLGGVNAYAQDCDQPCQLALAKSYFSGLEAVAKLGSTDKELNALFELFHDDVKYEHLNYEANFDRDVWRKAFLRNRERGAYTAAPEDGIQVQRVIHGKNHLALEYARGKRGEDGKWELEPERYLAIFGFRDGKIVLVRELW